MDSDRKRRTPRRPAPAVVAREERNRLTRAWLDVYASDSDFLVALESLADAHKTVVAELDELAYARGWRATGLTWRELTNWPEELGEQPSAVRHYQAAIRDFAARWSLHLLPDNQGFSALVDYCFARHVDAAPALKFAATVRSQPFAIKRLVPCSVSISLADLWDPTQETKSVPRPDSVLSSVTSSMPSSSGLLAHTRTRATSSQTPRTPSGGTSSGCTANR